VKPQDFIDLIGPAARACHKAAGVPASITVSQAALESGWGESGLTKKANNLFGIKADSLWRGETVTLDTKEFIRRQWVVVPAKWRKYPTWQASVDDHAAFLKRNPRYKDCFLCVSAQTFARALLNAGYATDPDYADKLIRLIGSYKLASLDGEGV
jgi:flagellum-specific peptidoglycan hydrolase FlgJ